MASGPVVTPDRSFDSLADQYERVRPGYPESVVDRILDFAQLTSGARLLEVGAGPAKATMPFARRGFRILAFEPGPNLARIARSRLADFRDVEVRTVSLEAGVTRLRSRVRFAAQGGTISLEYKTGLFLARAI